MSQTLCHQTSHQYRILKTVARVVGFIIGTLVAVVVWVVVRPVFRGIGRAGVSLRYLGGISPKPLCKGLKFRTFAISSLYFL